MGTGQYVGQIEAGTCQARGVRKVVPGRSGQLASVCRYRSVQGSRCDWVPGSVHWHKKRYHEPRLVKKEGESIISRSICVPLILGTVLAVSLPARARAADPSPLERYRNLEYPPTFENFSKEGWQERVLVEFDIVNSADLAALRAGLKDEDRFVRAIAARVLGIRGDKDSAEALAELVKSDPEAIVRSRAVESLGLLKMMPEVIEQAKNDSGESVRWVARMAAGELKSEVDSRELMQKAFATGIKADQLATAKVGEPAPDFAAHTSEGKPFKLSSILGKKPILLYFAAFDG